MDRMTPPPNYYGAPYPNFNQNMPNPQMPGQGPQPPMPNSANTHQPQMQPQNGFEEAIFVEKGPLNAQQSSDQICVSYTYADIAQANRGKKVKVYCSFSDSSQWHDMSLDGRILYGAEDHIAIETDETPARYVVIVGIYIDYMVFYEKPIIPQKKSV